MRTSSLFLRAGIARAARMKPNESHEVFDKGVCSVLAWQEGDLSIMRDDGVSCNMSHSSIGMLYYHKSNAFMRAVSGARYPIEGCDDLPLTFQSRLGDVPLLLRDVAHVSSLSCLFVFLRVVADNGHTYTGNHEGFTTFFSTGEPYFFPSVGRVSALVRYCVWLFGALPRNTPFITE